MRPYRTLAVAAFTIGASGAAACGPARAAGGAPTPVLPVALPPVPLVTGPLAPRVVYPMANAMIQARDSNFIFGSVGNGTAALTINGAPVPVLPNGAFLAWLPVPPHDAPRYELVVATATDTARLEHPVRLLPPVQPVADSLPGDTLRADSVRTAAPRIAARADSVLPPPRDTTPPFVVLTGAAPAVGAAPAIDTTVADTDRMVVVRPTPRGTYKWFLLPGTTLRQTGRDGDFVRVRLDSRLDAWVAAADVTPARAITAEPVRVIANAQVASGPEHVDLVLPTGARPAYFVEERGDALVLTLYGVQATTDIIAYRANDPFVRTVEWEQDATDRARYTVHLRERPFGYQVLWDRGRFVLRIRKPPRVAPDRPLSGLTIAVDPGHPPIGATGPTGLREHEATLWIGQRVQRLLQERGATVVMTRTTMDPVGLVDRPVMARRANAHALVSIHLNALPDGVNPFRAHGTGTYFFRAQSEPLARAVQRGMVAWMGLRNLGVYYDNLALTRPTWMPAILCEGAFLMIPEQESALRTPQFQEAYARGIVDGLEEYFRALGTARR